MIEKLDGNRFLFVLEWRRDVRGLSHGITVSAARRYFNSLGEPIIPVEYEKSGKPVFARGDRYLSVTHCGPFFAAVFAPFPIGIDAERRSEIRPRIVEKFFSPKERGLSFVRAWTAKEAVSKITGEGIGALHRVRVREGLAELDGKQYELEHMPLGDYLITLAWPKGAMDRDLSKAQ